MIKFYIVCVSITWLITQHRDFSKLHRWLFDRAYKHTPMEVGHEYSQMKGFIPELYGFIYDWITCPYCVGFWVAWFMSMGVGLSVVDIFVNGFISGIISMTLCSLLDRISR